MHAFETPPTVLKLFFWKICIWLLCIKLYVFFSLIEGSPSNIAYRNSKLGEIHPTRFFRSFAELTAYFARRIAQRNKKANNLLILTFTFEAKLIFCRIFFPAHHREDQNVLQRTLSKISPGNVRKIGAETKNFKVCNFSIPASCITLSASLV